MTLLENPLNSQGIMEQFHAFTRRFGFLGDFTYGSKHRRIDFKDWLGERLNDLSVNGWIIKKDDLSELTEKGREQAAKALKEIKKARSRFEILATPENASKLSLIVHLLLAVGKLPAGILSGSAGLLNDAIDTLLDGISNLMVYWGLRTGRERLVSRLLVVFMLATRVFALFESVMRMVRREPVGADWFAFTAILFSAVVCAVLWFVQRFIGLRRNSTALITQSVDSRNHVIVAASVYRRSQLRSYMLYLVRNGDAETKKELFGTVEKGFDFKENILLKNMGAERIEGSGDLIRTCYENLVRKGHLSGGERLEITPAGRKHLSSNRFFLSSEERDSG